MKSVPTHPTPTASAPGPTPPLSADRLEARQIDRLSLSLDPILSSTLDVGAAATFAQGQPSAEPAPPVTGAPSTESPFVNPADLRIYFAARNRLLSVLSGVSSPNHPIQLHVDKSTRDSVLVQLDRGTYYVDYSYPAFIEEGGKIAGIPVLWVHLRPRATNPEWSWPHPGDVIDEFYLLEHPYVEK